MSSTTAAAATTSTCPCHADFIPAGYHPQMPFLKLLQCALQQPISTCDIDSHMQQHYHCNSDDVKPKLEQQMDRSCITHSHAPLLPPSTINMSDCHPSRKPRKRKRRPCTNYSATKKREELVECQRRTHITVERNRRRLMNEYFVTLKSLIPPYLVQRGDQASVVGGAVHFIKDLEQQVISLQAEKQSRVAAGTTTNNPVVATNPLEGLGFFISPQYKGYYSSSSSSSCCRGELGGVDHVEATVVQGHINLKVAGRRPKRHESHDQLLALIGALQELKMSVLHFMLTAIDARSVLYCFNLKMEEGCGLGSADEIAAVVHHIFSYSYSYSYYTHC